ncbi:MAG: IS30 family transposase [Minisyncoccia bacterium]
MTDQVIGKFEPRSPLSYYERQVIETRLRGKWKVRQIGRYLNRSPGIISREIKRNIHPSGKYLADYAQGLADKRSRKTNKRKMDKDPELCRYVKKQFEEDLSPEQIAGRLKEFPPDDLKGKSISHESIYQYIYNSPYGAYLYNYLRYKTAPHRQKRHSRKCHKSFIPERISIHERSKIINTRERIGDWESDSVNFGKQRSALSVQHERKSLLVRLNKLADHGSEETLEALRATVESLPDKDLVKSITFDNGGEGAKHTEIRDEYGIDTYFCDPYKSWQKGGVENSNGLIRQYLPRETNLDKITQDMIYEIQEKLNNRPRKKLGYRTPNEVINSYLLNLQSVALNS